MLATVGGALGVALSWAGVEALRSLSPGDIPRLDEVGVNRATLLFGTGLVAVTTLLFGLAPALDLARTPIAGVLRQGGRGGEGRRSLGRAGLVVAEVGLSLVLRQGLRPAAAGVAVGILASVFAVDLLRTQLYGIAPNDRSQWRVPGRSCSRSRRWRAWCRRAGRRGFQRRRRCDRIDRLTRPEEMMRPSPLSTLARTGRTLLRQPGFTVLAVITLGLGIGASASMFRLVDRVLLRPLPFPAPERLVQVWGATPTRENRAASPADYLDWRGASRQLELAAYDVRSGNLLEAERAERVDFAWVSGNFLRTLDTPPSLGRDFSPSAPASASEAILTDAFWKTRYGADPSVLGRSLRMDDRALTVVGVAPPDAGFPAGVDLLVRAAYDVPPVGAPGDIRQVRDAWYFRVIGRLRAGATMESARAEMRSIARRLSLEYPQADHDATVRLVPLQEEITGPVRPRLLLLFAAATVLLLIATANVVTLLVVRTMGRTGEIVIRHALGASRRRLVGQLVGEAALLSAVGALAGTTVAWAVDSGAARLLVPTGMTDGGSPVPLALLFSGIVSAVLLPAVGLVPAVLATRSAGGGWLGERTASGRRSISRLRSGLVVAEVALGVLLLLGAGLMLRSVSALGDVDPGFEPDGLLTARVAVAGGRTMDPERLRSLYLEMTARAAALPGISTSAAALSGPADDGPSAGLRIEGRDNSEGSLPDNSWQAVSTGYFRSAGIRLLKGRVFDARDGAGSPPVAVINHTMARMHWGDRSPLGARVNTGLDGDGVWVRVVGVVDDTRNESLREPASPEMYRPLAQPSRLRPDMVMLLLRGSGAVPAVTPALRRAVGDVSAEAPIFDVRTGQELLRSSWSQPLVLLSLLGSFAVLALILSIVGVYGLIAHAVTQRSREIGVRVAVGARPSSIVGFFLSRGIRLAATGGALGLAAAIPASRLLDRFLFGVTGTDPATLAAVPALLLLAAALASAVPAARAARLDPVESLRAE